MKTAVYFFSFLVLVLGGPQCGLIAALVDYSAYRNVCANAAMNDDVFQIFKNEPAYRMILEHVNREQGEEYLKFIAGHYPHLLKKIGQFQKNDLLGSPLTFNYPDIGKTSPTTLRYIKVLGDLERHFGNLEQRKIIEIGGGYGGQCLILSKLYAFKEYHIVDLLEPMMLTQKYLDLADVSNFRCIDPMQLPENEHYDLVISNYAFTELDRADQDLYFEKIFKKAAHGYLTLNCLRFAPIAGTYSLDELVSKLRSYGFTPQVFDEDPQTGNKENWNLILIW